MFTYKTQIPIKKIIVTNKFAQLSRQRLCRKKRVVMGNQYLIIKWTSEEKFCEMFRKILFSRREKCLGFDSGVKDLPAKLLRRK